MADLWQGFSRILLEISSLVSALVIPQLPGDGEMLICFGRSAKALIRLAEEVLDVVILRVQFDRALKVSGGHRRIVALQANLAEQNI